MKKYFKAIVFIAVVTFFSTNTIAAQNSKRNQTEEQEVSNKKNYKKISVKKAPKAVLNAPFKKYGAKAQEVAVSSGKGYKTMYVVTAIKGKRKFKYVVSQEGTIIDFLE